METRNVKISLETAQRWCNGTDNELKQLAVQTYPELAKKELPESWAELNEITGYYVGGESEVFQVFGNKNFCNSFKQNRNVFATKEQAEASIAMAQLSQLMKVYNDGWEPDWTKGTDKYSISFYKEDITICHMIYARCFLTFKEKETAELFLENFRELIEQAKPLL